MKRSLIAVSIVMAACTQVVVDTTHEVRPNRYAILEFTQQLASHDSAIAYAQRAVLAEGLKLQRAGDKPAPVVTQPVHFAAEGELPALDATIRITSVTSGSETRFRIFASAELKPSEVGGVDARLMSLIDRLAKRLDSLIAP